MKTRLTLKPGDNGTKKLQAKYGARLLAVRYRYDAERKLRLKTVELVEDEQAWLPRAPEDDPLVRVHLTFQEEALRLAVKDAGGLWLRDLRLWQLRRSAARRLGLEARIVG